MADKKKPELGSTLPDWPDPNREPTNAEPEYSWLDWLSDASSGAGYGLADQLQNTAEMVRHPWDTAQAVTTGTAKAINDAVNDPKAAGLAAIKGVKDFANKATSNPFEFGRAVGTNVNPRSWISSLGRPNIRGIFVGEKSAVWDHDAANRAVKMENAGAHPRDIWQETGTWRGPDGKLRQEIDDSASKIKGNFLNDLGLAKKSIGPMGQTLSHEELYKAYPDLADIKSYFDLSKYEEGVHNPPVVALSGHNYGGEKIAVSGRNPTQQRNVALHELQHAVQSRENFGLGGNPEYLRLVGVPRGSFETYSYLKELIDGSAKILQDENASKIEKMNAKKFIDTYTPQLSKLRNASDPYGAYMRLTGEAEARAVQARKDLTPEQRRAKFPEESYDVPIDELLRREDLAELTNYRHYTDRYKSGGSIENTTRKKKIL